MAVLRSRWPLILIVAVLAVVGALAASLSTPKAYTSRATLIVGQSLSAVNPDIGQITASQRLSDTYAQIVTTRPRLQAVIDNLKLTMGPDELRAHVSATVPQDSTLLTIAVELGDPSTAAAVANGLAAELMATSPTLRGRQTDIQQFVTGELRALQAQIQDSQQTVDQLISITQRTLQQDQQLQTAEARLDSLRSSYAALLSYTSDSSANELTVVEPAVAPSAPSSPRVLMNVAVALVLGLLLGIGLAFLAEYLDESVKTPQDVERATGAPVLGLIPRMRLDASQSRIYSVATMLYPRTTAAEAFRSLRTNLEFTGIDAPIKTILVTSAMPREGKTTVACNLAVAYAQAGRRTLLLDADLRRPETHLYFGLQNVDGLTNLLRADSLLLKNLAHETEVPNLLVMTCGTIPPNPAELLASTRMAQVMGQIAASAEIVIIDSPPLNVVTDATILARLVDGVVLVVDAGRTPRHEARQASETLGRVDARILGVTLNREATPDAAGPYGYYSDEGRSTEPVSSTVGGSVVGAGRRGIRRWPRRDAP
jgi:capsular exopolysaccharide synthesis family protein